MSGGPQISHFKKASCRAQAFVRWGRESLGIYRIRVTLARSNTWLPNRASRGSSWDLQRLINQEPKSQSTWMTILWFSMRLTRLIIYFQELWRITWTISILNFQRTSIHYWANMTRRRLGCLEKMKPNHF